MSSRRPRELPKIDIGGTLFYLDLRLNEFREVANFANRINLDSLYELPNGEIKLAFNKRTRNLFKGTSEEFAKSKNVIEVTLPSQYDMDPLGFVWLMEDQGWINAAESKMKTEQLLKEYQIHSNGMVRQLKQKAIPLLEKRKNIKNKRGGRKL